MKLQYPIMQIPFKRAISFALVLVCCLACKTIPSIDDSNAKGANANDNKSTAVVVIPKSKTDASQTVSIDWLSPSSADLLVKSPNGKVEVKLRIHSKSPITLDQIDILFNGLPIGNKAGEVGLAKRPEFKDQILTAQLPIQTGTTTVQIVVVSSNDQRYFSEMTFVKNQNEIKVLPKRMANSSTRVIWTQPDAFALKENEMFNTKNKELEIRFNISTPLNITLENVQVLINKIYRKPSPQAELRGSAGSFSFRDLINLNEDLPFNEIALKISSGNISEESQRLKVNYSPIRPNLYILSIGPKTNLKYSEKDARDFAKLYAAQGKEIYKLFNQIYIDTLLGNAATTQSIRIAIASINTKIRTGAIAEDDVVILFFSSHGFIQEGELYIQADDYNSSAPTVTSIPYKKDIVANIEKLPCKKLIFIDACHGGGARANVSDINKALSDLRSTPRGMAVFASSTDQEESYEDIVWANGAFTECILKGLKEGKADSHGYGNENGIVTFNEIERYVKNEVPKLVKEIKNKSQNPKVTRNELGDIPLFIVKKN